ncbi:MAG: protein kinase [Planctomycetota bacterium]
MDRSHRQAAHLFQQGRVPEQALRWALGQAGGERDLCEVLLEQGWISGEVAHDARAAAQDASREARAAAERGGYETEPLPGGERPASAPSPAPAPAREAKDESAWPSGAEPAPVPGEVPVERLGPYRLLRKLGQGGMGMVFLAEHTLLRRQVALKRIRPRADVDPRRALSRFEVEARAMARLEHPHILRVLDIRVEQDAAYMVVEHAPGGSLAERLRTRGKLAADEAVRLIGQLARALQHAHEHAVVHRDVKPDNVLFDAEDNALLTDFGLAKNLDESLSMTRPGTIVGTLLYMAPEQVQGLPVDARVDVYALGVTLYELLSGQVPFNGDTHQRVIDQILRAAPPPLPREVPGPVATIVARCLAKDREDRYPSAQALAEDCRRYLAREPILAQPVGAAERLALWRRRNPILAWVVVAATFLLALLPGLLDLVWQRRLVDEARDEAQRQERLRQVLEANLAEVTSARAHALLAEREARAASGELRAELAEAERLRADLLARAGQRRRAWRRYLSAARALRAAGRDPVPADLGAWDLWRRAPAALLPLPGEGARALALRGELALVGRGRRLERWDLRRGARQVLGGHERDVSALAIARDAPLALSGGQDGQVLLWRLDAAPGADAAPRLLGTHAQEEVTAVAISPRGDLALSAGDGALHLWALDAPPPRGGDGGGRGQRPRRSALVDGVLCLAFLEPGRFVVGRAASCEVWDLRAWRREREVLLPGAALAVGPAGDRVASGAAEEVRVWSPADGRELARLTAGALGRLRGLGFSAAGERVLALDDAGALAVWSVGRAELLARYALVCDGVERASIAGDSVLAGDAEELRLWRATPGAEAPRVRAGPSLGAACVAGQACLLGTRAGEVELLDPELELCLLRRRHGASITALAARGDAFLSGAADGSVARWSLSEPGQLARVREHAGPVRALAWAPGGDAFAAGSEVLDAGSLELPGESPARAALPGLPAGRLDALYLEPDGALRARAGGQETRAEALALRAWSLVGEPRDAWVTGEVWALAWPEDDLLISAGLGGVIARWSRGSGAPRARVQAPGVERAGPLLALGAERALVAQGPAVVEWLLEAPPRARRELRDPDLGRDIVALARGPGQLVLAAHEDGVVAVWELEEGRLLARLEPPPGLGRPVALLSWPAAGRTLLVGEGGEVWRWELGALGARIALEEALERWRGLPGDPPPAALLARLATCARAWDWVDPVGPAPTPVVVARGRGDYAALHALLPDGADPLASARRAAVARAAEVVSAETAARAALDAEHPDVALSRLESVLTDAGATRDPWLEAAVRDALGQRSAAEPLYRRALELDPDGAPPRATPLFLVVRSSWRLQRERELAALLDLERLEREKVLIVGDDYARLRLSLGDADGALALLDALRRRGHEDASYERLRAEALGALGRHEEALSAWDQALRVRPDDLDALLGRAGALRALGRATDSLQALRRVIELRPAVLIDDYSAPIVDTLRAGTRALERAPEFVKVEARFEPKPRGGWHGVNRLRVEASAGAVRILGFTSPGRAQRPAPQLLAAHLAAARAICRFAKDQAEGPARRKNLAAAVEHLRQALAGGLSWEPREADEDLGPLRDQPAYQELLRAR